MCMDVCLNIHLCNTGVQGPQWIEEGIGSPGTEIIASCVLEIKPGFSRRVSSVLKH